MSSGPFPLSRIDLADLVALDDIVNEIHRLLPDCPIPVPVEELARALDIEDIHSVDTSSYEAALVLSDIEKSSGTILVNSATSRRRRRFSIGHELGHFLSPTHRPMRGSTTGCQTVDMRLQTPRKNDVASRVEVQANRFAAKLLMPERAFRREIKRSDAPSLQAVVEISNLFDVSKEATARRYVELHDTACAIIFSESLRFMRPYRSSDFPFVNLKPGDGLPRTSASATFMGPPGTFSEFIETDKHQWLDATESKKVGYMAEQVLLQNDDFRMTLLIAELTDEQEEEDELVESWTPCFRK